MTAQAKHHTVRVRALAAAATTAVVLGAAGCSGGSSSSAETATAVTSAGSAPISAAGAAPTSAAAAAATSGAAAPSAAPAPSAGAAAAPASAAAASSEAGSSAIEGRPAFGATLPVGHSVIYTATVNVEVLTAKEVASKADQAAQDAQTDSGYVFSRNQQAAVPAPQPVVKGQPQPPASLATADLVIKVPPEEYGSLLFSLESLGNPLNVNQASQDVTNQMVDTKARLTTYQASVARVRTLLTKATTIGQIVEVEGELTKREADLESMEGELNVLKAQTSYATITLHLQQKAPVVKQVVPPTPKPKKHIHGFVSGLKAGGRGFATVAIGVATVLGATLPFLGVLIGLALIAWFTRRFWRRSHREVRTEQAAL